MVFKVPFSPNNSVILSLGVARHSGGACSQSPSAAGDLLVLKQPVSELTRPWDCAQALIKPFYPLSLVVTRALDSLFLLKRRRVTAEMEGKYIINMPKGTTPRTKKILEQQAAKGLQRTSVFDRLGAEAKADATTGGKPTGVFSRLGDTLGTDGDKATESDDDCSVLQYAGVLKKLTKPPRKESTELGGTIKAKATSSEAKPVTVTAAIQQLGHRNATGIRMVAKPQPVASKISGIRHAVSVKAQDGNVTSTKDKSKPEIRVTIKRTWGCGKVSSTSETPGAQMDSAGTVSVFKRLGKKPD
uniref:Chromosome 19 open reading frame 47 n=1 Tax=Aquila chrysaetos chrysaetos TaxID=223781 RepID=A0A663FIV6_AQUCH